jgi:hypothetical protein
MLSTAVLALHGHFLTMTSMLPLPSLTALLVLCGNLLMTKCMLPLPSLRVSYLLRHYHTHNIFKPPPPLLLVTMSPRVDCSLECTGSPFAPLPTTTIASSKVRLHCTPSHIATASLAATAITTTIGKAITSIYFDDVFIEEMDTISKEHGFWAKLMSDIIEQAETDSNGMVHARVGQKLLKSNKIKSFLGDR